MIRNYSKRLIFPSRALKCLKSKDNERMDLPSMHFVEVLTSTIDLMKKGKVIKSDKKEKAHVKNALINHNLYLIFKP